MLTRGKDGNIETESVVKFACEAAKTLIQNNPQAVQVVLEDGGLIDSLIVFLNCIPLEQLHSWHLGPLYFLQIGENEEELQLLFKKGIIEAISRSLESEDKQVLFVATFILSKIFNAQKSLIKDGVQNPFFSQFERNGTLGRLQRIIKNVNISEDILGLVALSLGFIYKSSPIPQDIIFEVIKHLKRLLQGQDNYYIYVSLMSLAALGECEDNHPALISENIIADIALQLNSECDITSATYTFCVLLASDENMRNSIREQIPIEKMRELTNYEDEIIRLNSKEMLSWMMCPQEMKCLAKIQHDYQDKTAEERGQAVEEGFLDEAYKILKRIIEGEEDIAGAKDPVCNVISILIKGNAQFLPSILEQGGLADLLIKHIEKSNPNETITNQIEPLVIIVNECLDKQLRDLFRKGIVKVMSRQLNNEDSRVVTKAIQIIRKIVESGSADSKDGQPNQFRESIESDEILIQLFDLFKKSQFMEKEIMIRTLPSQINYSMIIVLPSLTNQKYCAKMKMKKYPTLHSMLWLVLGNVKDMQLAQQIESAISGDSERQLQALQWLSEAKKLNYGEFISLLSQLLCTDSMSLMNRQIAGIILKNSLDDEDEQQQNQWVGLNVEI
ncbi:MAG: hypothetical protein EZS28_027479 [Streblomastix strix]|uniref:Importin N-terminal domain-containing protein n=1 Tax=Streblomastix strix TaxID=222440 RepID=A0A5J4V394_9EUKA|nr:MAG: hypothetical protein EZS28_027479 [Streblomastix strix]